MWGMLLFFFLPPRGERARSRPREVDFATSLLEAILYFTNTPTHSSTKYIGMWVRIFFRIPPISDINALSELCYSLLVTSMSIIDGRNVINQLYPRVQMRPGDLAEAHQ